MDFTATAAIMLSHWHRNLIFDELGRGHIPNVAGDITLHHQCLNTDAWDASVIVSSVQDLRNGLYPPAVVFGKPDTPSCLDGIGEWMVDSPARTIRRVARGRVVGNTAVLSGDARLYSPEPLFTGEPSDIVGKSRADYWSNVVLALKSDAPIVIFAGRPEPSRHYRNAFFFHNVEQANFGSFIFRQLPQLLSIRDVVSDIDCYITPDRTSFFMEALQVLDLPPRPVLTVREICGDVFDQIYFMNLFDNEGFFAPSLATQMQELARKVADSQVCYPRSIFVSRYLSGLARPNYRVLTNEMQLTERARARGLTEIHSETLSFASQMALFSQARRIIGPSGSGMLNAAFSPIGARVVDLESFHVTVRQHAKIYASTQKDYAFLFGSVAGGDQRGKIERNWAVDVDDFEASLDWLLQ